MAGAVVTSSNAGAAPSLGRLAPSPAQGPGRDVTAQPSPAVLLENGIGNCRPGGQHGDDVLQRVDGVVAGRDSFRPQGLLRRSAAYAAPNSPENKVRSGETVAPKRRQTCWTEERITALGDLFEAGWSHELMAQALGTSKGAISGKLVRLAEIDPKRWTRLETTIVLDRNVAAAQRAEERRAHIAMAGAREGSILGVCLVDLERHQCRWPLAYTTEQTFCAAERAMPSSYCPDHRAGSVTR